MHDTLISTCDEGTAADPGVNVCPGMPDIFAYFLFSCINQYITCKVTKCFNKN